MRFLMVITFCLCFFLVNSQPNNSIKDTLGQNSERQFKYPLGETVCGIKIEAQTNWDQWRDYLKNNLVIDDTILEVIPPGKYRVLVQFAIDIKGKLSDVKVINDPGYGLGPSFEILVSKYTGQWKSAQFNGRAIPSYRIQPIIFTVADESNDECEGQLPKELIL